MGRKIFTLIKFGSTEHIRQLQDEGLMFFNTLAYYQHIEDGHLRGDQDEGIHSVYQSSSARIIVDDGSEAHTIDQSSGLVDIVKFSMCSDVNTNVYCMTAITDSNFGPVDPRNFKFGDTFLVLTNTTEFFNRVKRAVFQSDLGLRGQFVEYIDRNSYSGQMGEFRKFSKFEYQSEYRFVLDQKFGEPYRLRIGSIDDISVIGTANEFNELLDIKHKDEPIYIRKHSATAI